MKGPVPDRVYREVTVTKTGDVAMTAPNTCYDCSTAVRGAPLMKYTLEGIDARISVWMCGDCYETALAEEHEGWNDASRNL